MLFMLLLLLSRCCSRCRCCFQQDIEPFLLLLIFLSFLSRRQILTEGIGSILKIFSASHQPRHLPQFLRRRCRRLRNIWVDDGRSFMLQRPSPSPHSHKTFHHILPPVMSTPKQCITSLTSYPTNR